MCMRVLPNIELTEEQYDYMIGWYSYDSGAESNLYKIPKLFGVETITKIWNDETPVMILENKFKKIKELYQIQELEQINDIRIVSSVSYKGRVIGYVMNYSSDIPLYDVCVSRWEKMAILMRVHKKLKRFEELGIIYSDVSCANILVGNHNEVTLCDLDNVALPKLNLKMDCYRDEVKEFINNYGQFDEKVTSYTFNLLTISQLYFLEEYELVKEYLESEQIPEEFEPSAYCAIRDQMRIVTPEYEGLYLTDYVKPKYKSIAKKF